MAIDTTVSTRASALLAASDRIASAFDHGLDQLAVAFNTIEMAIRATRYAGLALHQLASSLAIGKQQLTAARSMFVFEPDESGIERYVSSEHSLVEWIEQQLRDPKTDAKAIARLQEDFLEHEPADRIAIAVGLHGAWLIRNLIVAVEGSTTAHMSASKQLQEASWALGAARDHLRMPVDPFGVRYESYLARYTQLAGDLQVMFATAES